MATSWFEMTSEAEFWEIDHTADRALEVSAPDFEEMLRQAAAGMYEIAGVEVRCARRTTRFMEFDGKDDERLLVAFLSELLYALQTARIAFDDFDVEISEGEGSVAIEARGHPVDSIDMDIKAVTWHDLAVDRTDGEVRGRVTFDV